VIGWKTPVFLDLRGSSCGVRACALSAMNRNNAGSANLGLIAFAANKYCEGKMESTVKRE